MGAVLGASGIQTGSQNPAVGDQSSIRGFKNCVPEGGRQKVRKMTRNRVPKLMFFGRLQPRKSCSRVGAVRILLKQVVAEMSRTMTENGSQNGPKHRYKMGPWALRGWICNDLRGFWKELVFHPDTLEFLVLGAQRR